MGDDLTHKNLDAAMEKIHLFAKEWEDSFMIHGTGNPYGLHTLLEARREAAISRSLLASALEREKMLVQQIEAAMTRADYWESLMSDQAEIIRALRKELIEAHDIAGRAEGERSNIGTPHDPFRDFSDDRRRIGG